jgi:hypothetical protein
MSMQAQREALVAVIASVPEVGLVHDRERYAANETAFRELYLFTPTGGSQQVRGWWVRRSATAEYAINTVRTVNVITWTVRGYMSFNDAQASELTFDGLIEAIRSAVRADSTLGGVCPIGPLKDGEDATDGVQVTDAGPVMFAGVLCHSAVLQLKTWSYL